MSIADLLKILKSRNVNIDTLTRQQVIDAGYDGQDGISLVISDVKRAYGYQQNPPKPRRKATPKKRTRKSRANQSRRSFHAEQVLSRGRATLELVEQVNEVEAEEPNPLQLVDTSPGELYPTFVVVHPDDSDDWLTANLPDTGYSQLSPADNGLAAGMDY